MPSPLGLVWRPIEPQTLLFEGARVRPSAKVEGDHLQIPSYQALHLSNEGHDGKARASTNVKAIQGSCRNI